MRRKLERMHIHALRRSSLLRQSNSVFGNSGAAPPRATQKEPHIWHTSASNPPSKEELDNSQTKLQAILSVGDQGETMMGQQDPRLSRESSRLRGGLKESERISGDL